MRKFNLFAILAVGFIFAACSHPPVSEQQRRSASIKRSVLPVFVTGYETSTHQRLTSEGVKTVAIADFKACSAVYVAPHLLATSTSAFFTSEGNGVTTYDSESITILNGTTRFHPADVPFFDSETGLVLIRTDYAGVPLPLRGGVLAKIEPLKKVGFTFRLAPSGILGIPSWDIGPATPGYMVDSLSSIDWFSVHTTLHLGNCGASLIDDAGRLVGIIHKRIGEDQAVVIGSALIAQAVKSVSNE